jgi:hypothetical protein
MQSHWKTLQWLTVLALALFVFGLMTGNYVMTYGVLISAFVVLTNYLIAVGRFQGGPDAS